MRFLLHLSIVAALTALTQLGGIAWLASLWFRRRLPAFAALYIALMLLAVQSAPLLGRQALSCSAGGPLQVQSWFYCLTNRVYVSPELATLAQDLAAEMDSRFPGTITLALDGSFPFPGMPLLPHLSHSDGRKLDLAYYYRNAGGYLPGATRSPLGYFAFEDGPTTCPPDRVTLRWDLAWLQPFFADLALERDRMQAMLRWLAEDPRVDRVFIEPHLATSLGVASARFGFQGCRAARHDDHIHIQL